ncbi:MAG: radical SAM protein [Nitrospirae bacterium]|nr:radical SAM protein [Nitrospirota bacterium]
MLLIFPPAAKPCEPPAGIAKLAGALNAQGISCSVLDANLEGLLSLMRKPQTASDTWTRRAVKNSSSNLASLRDPRTYRSPDHYSRAVKDVNRVLEASAREFHAILGLADYHHQQLSPVRSNDLINAAQHPEQNPFYPYFKVRLLEIITETGPPLIGFSLNYLSQALSTFAMIGFIRREFPGLKIVLGGGLVTSWMKGPAWKDPFGGLVDHCIAGPGEGPLLELLGVKENGHPHVTPDYGSLPHEEYLSPGFILPYSASSGCYWNKCSFCPETAEETPYVPVPTELAMSDLKTLIAKTDPILVHLLDNAISPALMRALANEPPGVPWYGFARIGNELTDRDYCMQLKRSGCRMLKLGLESGDQGVLDRLRKGIDLATASLVLKNLHAAGIAAYVYLLFGTPAETIREARKTLEFVAAHREAITFLNLAIFNMPLCGHEAREHVTEHFYEGDLSLYTAFKHLHGWDRRAVRHFLDNEFKKHSAVSAILKNDPPIFTSNHAAFFARP